jgi:hypothetical protein
MRRTDARTRADGRVVVPVVRVVLVVLLPARRAGEVVAIGPRAMTITAPAP